jgi:hypothetical protein
MIERKGIQLHGAPMYLDMQASGQGSCGCSCGCGGAARLSQHRGAWQQAGAAASPPAVWTKHSMGCTALCPGRLQALLLPGLPAARPATPAAPGDYPRSLTLCPLPSSPLPAGHHPA